MQIIKQLPDNGAFVVRRDNHRKSFLRDKDLVFFAPPHTAETDDEIINRKQKNKDLHRNHDEVKPMFHE